MQTSSWAPPRPADRTETPSATPPAIVLPTPTLREASTPVAFDRRAALPTWFGEVSHHEPHQPVVEARDLRGLLPNQWCRRLWLVCQVLAVAAALWWPAVALGLTASSLVLLVAWSGLAAVNVRRARPRTVYSSPPSGLLAASAWLFPGAIVVLAILAVDRLERSGFASDLGVDDRTTRIRVVVGLVAIVPLLLALYLPYGVLARATAWVGGDGRRWRQFFWLPVLVALFAGLVRLLLGATIGFDAADGSLEVAGRSALVLDVALAFLPTLVVWWLGSAAMTETERACRLTWEQRNFPEGTLDLSDEMAGRAAVAAYLASHPNG